jgi:hypothetical protein
VWVVKNGLKHKHAAGSDNKMLHEGAMLIQALFF